MTYIFIIAFWVFFFLIIYSYVLYPFSLSYLAKHKSLNYASYSKEQVLPTVAIIISVLNEEIVIEEKINSILKADYPTDNLTVWIGSDGSTDDTNRIILRYATQHPHIRFFPFEHRRGKTTVLNALYTECLALHPDILIFTDANVFFEKELVFETIKYFKDHKIGQVAANVLNTIPKAKGIAHQEKDYIQRENTIKYHEGLLWGAMQGAFGACYAIRTSLYVPFPDMFVADDFYLSMQVLKQGYKAILNPQAVCFEDVSSGAKEEYHRKARISAGSFSNLSIFKGLLLNPFTIVGFTFISHKLIRWLTPFFLILMPLFCIGIWNKFYLGLFVVQVFMMLMPLWDKLLNLFKLHIDIVRLAGYFYYMNLALLTGFFKYLKGERSHGWTPTPRNV